ncbi:hypothetical protein [Actinophytocola sp.]|uniref:hypothetical protein n=1 Tax=Actinophytocola sp. TaxID=1872138 RepID=UPI002D7E3F8F|nr:hypothetical protein [Actinophytocola sp.]HET9144091.1 hypothetical protein [Actinophytocola sp.]
MSGDHRELSFAILTADYEHWTPEQRAAAEADPNTSLYSDYAVALVAEAMHAAGQAVIDAHPEMFRGELI